MKEEARNKIAAKLREVSLRTIFSLYSLVRDKKIQKEFERCKTENYLEELTAKQLQEQEKFRLNLLNPYGYPSAYYLRVYVPPCLGGFSDYIKTLPEILIIWIRLIEWEIERRDSLYPSQNKSEEAKPGVMKIHLVLGVQSLNLKNQGGITMPNQEE